MPPIRDILNTGTPNEVIGNLKKKTIVVPAWANLQKEYYPKQHPVMTDKQYRDRVKKGRIERMTRVTLAYQKLATKRMAELMFTIPVQRIYKSKNDNEKQAAAIMEAIFKKNHINAENIKRGRKLFASCEFITIWYAQEKETTYAGHKSPLKLRCRTYSPMDGAKCYPLFDEYDDMIALSVQYSRQEGTTTHYFDCYTDEEHRRWVNTGSGWKEDPTLEAEKHNIGKIQGIYGWRPEPIWEDQSDNIYEAEWTLSRNGNYLRRNSIPKWVIFSDKTIKFDQEQDDDRKSREILKYGKDDKAMYATWNLAIEDLKFHIEQIRNNFFMTLQLPDMSMESMKTTPMSGEARKMMFIDCQLKVGDESGDWLEWLDREVNVVKAFCKLMFPDLAGAFETLEVENLITPFSIRDESEKIRNITDTTGGKAIASRKTAVKRLGWVSEEELDDEIAEIEKDEQVGMGDIFNQEPTK